MPEDDKAGDPQNNGGKVETYTKADVEKLVNDAVLKTEGKFEQKIKDLNAEAAKNRIDAKGGENFKKMFAEMLGMKPEEIKSEDIVNSKIAEIAKKNKELEDKWNAAEQKANRLEKQAQAKELAEKAGLKAKAVKLIDLNAEDLEAELAKVAEEFPELKESKSLGGGGANPTDFSTASINPYKAESFNLTAQSKLELANPALAAKFKAEAGLK